jgi:hypothetical protein
MQIVLIFLILNMKMNYYKSKRSNVKNSKLYLNDNKYIKIYSKNKNLLPKDGEKSQF